MSKILVLNMGMKSIRSIVFDESGEKLSSFALPLTTQLNEEQVMQDPNEWWEKARTVVRACLRDLRDNRIEYMTVTASSSCLVCIDEKGTALGRCIMVSDKRAQAETIEIRHSSKFKEVGERTGLDVDASMMLPKILWVKHHEPKVYERTAKFLSPNDFLVGKLTGVYCTDLYNAQKYHYDLQGCRYPEELLQELGIPEDKLPEVLEPGEYIGRIRKSAAEETGLSEETKVVLSTYDAICSFFGSGVSKEGEASDASGTVTAFRAYSTQKNLKPSEKVFTTPFCRWGIKMVGGSNNLGGGLIEWVKQCYYLKEQYPYEVMEKEANEVTLGAGGLIFLPYLLGERAPIWDSKARGVFFGLERSHTRKDMTRAVFESTGFIDLDMIRAIEETGVKVNKIKLSGGLARNFLVSQIKADVTGRVVEILEDFETTAIGAAVLAMVGQGVYRRPEEASEQFVKVRMIINPNEQKHKKYLEVYGMYKESYQKMKRLFEERMDMVNRIYATREISIENL